MAISNMLPCLEDLSNWEWHTTVLLHIFNAKVQHTSPAVHTVVHPRHSWLVSVTDQ